MPRVSYTNGDQEVRSEALTANLFPFPCTGTITLAARNAEYGLGPVMLHLVMQPGSGIPAHVHNGVAEVLYVVEGEFINEGVPYPKGTSLHVRAGKPHGPHATDTGCTLLVLWTERTNSETADLDDFAVVDRREEEAA